jgi:shikimate kinase
MIHDRAQIIFLIGFMGSGKTHEGKLLAENLGLPFIDLDAWIEEKEGQTIASIFSTKGEEYFRIQESQAIKDVYQILIDLNHKDQDSFGFKGVVSTGGGAPCFFDNMEWMNQHGITIWLDVPVEMLMDRLKKEKAKRPLLAEKTDEELKAFIADKLKERNAFYSRAALHLTALPTIDLLIQKIKDA